jgi:hypothetical protein
MISSFQPRGQALKFFYPATPLFSLSPTGRKKAGHSLTASEPVPAGGNMIQQIESPAEQCRAFKNFKNLKNHQVIFQINIT